MGSRRPSFLCASKTFDHFIANSVSAPSRGMKPLEKVFCRPLVLVPATSETGISMTPKGISAPRSEDE
jgi:hypothetical protein